MLSIPLSHHEIPPRPHAKAVPPARTEAAHLDPLDPDLTPEGAFSDEPGCLLLKPNTARKKGPRIDAFLKSAALPAWRDNCGWKGGSGEVADGSGTQEEDRDDEGMDREGAERWSSPDALESAVGFWPKSENTRTRKIGSGGEGGILPGVGGMPLPGQPGEA